MQNKDRQSIAVIISKAERKYQQGLLEGICKSAYAKDMNVVVFSTSLLEGSEEHQRGETQIFDLINYDKFAGVVYAGGSFYGKDYTRILEQKMLEVSATGKPVVVVDSIVEGLPCYFNDDANALMDIIEHFVVEHGLEDIAFMTGFHGNPHAENAVKAYKSIMEQHELEVSEDHIYYGDYWYNAGDSFVEQLIGSQKGPPEAIVCVNEHMAISVYQALHKRGIYVPKHIRLACTANDASYAPYLLVGENSCANVGYAACESIFCMLRGEEVKKEVKFFPCKNVLRTNLGCGCQKTSAYDYSKDRGIMIDTDPGFFGEFNFDRGEMLAKKNYAELFREFDHYTRYIGGFKEFYMCLCDGWDSPHFLIQDTRENPYTDLMQLYYSRKETANGPQVFIGENQFFPKEEMLPNLFDASDEPSLFLFRALHFLDRNYGYIVLNNGHSFKTHDIVLNYWLHDVVCGLESQCRLQSVNYMFYTDIMTGLYNRNGFNTMLPDIIADAQEKRKQIMLVMADLNRLKKINDTYGHKEGDFAITEGAHLLQGQKMPGAEYEKNFRIGGDEYVKIAVGEFNEQMAREFREKLYKTAKEVSYRIEKPYRLEMSVGFCYGEMPTMESLESSLAIADNFMYMEKQRLKSENPV